MSLNKSKLFGLKAAGIYVFVFLAVFSIARFALFISSHTFFKELSAADIFFSFLEGLRFDILAICTFCGIFLLLINIPFNSRIFIKINCIFLNIIFLFFSFFLSADIIYFKIFEKHFTTEPLLVKNHLSYFLSLAFGDYLFVTVTIILFIISLFYFSFKIINKHFFPPCKKIIFNIATISLLSVALVIAVRGGIQNRILSIGDAYKYSRITGELKLNGVFTSLISIRTRTSPNKININFDDALKIVQENVIVNNEEIIVDSNYPLMRKRIKFNVNGKNYNIVIILLESWQKDYIDSLAGTNYGVTPNFDALVKESIVYNRFYANGQRSIMALTSVFFSFPYVKGLTYAGYGLENYGQTKLPLILAKNGYDNVYVQGDKRESDNAIAFAYFLGFKEAYGKQDIPLKYNYLPISKGYDIEGLIFFLNKINSLKNPFIAFYFTTTTHIPYERTILKSMEKYPEDGTKITGYLNRLYYSDYALGKFINKAKQEKWFKNTVFILCADHQAYGVGGITGNFEKTKADKLFKIPAIIYCPALFNPQKTDKLSSQLDIIPTIIDILNIKTPYSSLGKSLFSKEPNRFVFLSCEGEQVYFINSDKVTQQDWQNPADVENKNDKNLLLATEKVVYNLIMHDKWFNNKVILN